MCLIKKGKVKTTKITRTFYKILLSRNDVLLTPFQEVVVNYDKLYEEDGHFRSDIKYVYGDGFHLFKDLKGIQKYFTEMYSYFSNSYFSNKYYPIIVKAIVPKGTEYVEGNFDSACGLFPSIVVKKVKYIPMNNPTLVHSLLYNKSNF